MYVLIYLMYLLLKLLYNIIQALVNIFYFIRYAFSQPKQYIEYSINFQCQLIETLLLRKNNRCFSKNAIVFVSFLLPSIILLVKCNVSWFTTDGHYMYIYINGYTINVFTCYTTVLYYSSWGENIWLNINKMQICDLFTVVVWSMH